MKNILKYISIAVVGTMFLASCIKEIDPQTSYVTVDQAAEAPGSFNNYVSAITSSLTGTFTFGSSNAWDFGYPSFFLIRDVMGNDIVLEDSSSEHYSSWYSCGQALGPQYLVCQAPWTYFYGWIKNCNTVLSLAGEKPSDEMKSGAGIAYAMRAMFYMDLARMFATKSYAFDPEAITVPMILETTSTSQLVSNPRATNKVIWEQILSDLDKAEEYLANYQRPDKYTPDLSVVYGLKARAYLTMENWAKAEEYAKMAQSGYTALNEAQWTSRTDGFNTPNDSWMFALTYKSTDENILENDADTSWGSEMIIEVAESGCGYAANYGNPKRIDYHLYQTIPDTDFRKKSFVDFAIDDMTSLEEVITALSAYSDSPEGLLNNTAAVAPSQLVGGLCVKFRPKGGEHSNQYTGFTVAVPLMRVEEMMLIEIEAAGMQDEGRGKSLLTAFAVSRDPSYEYGNHMRENYGSSYATQFQNEVWWQRRVELWGEGFATFDIKRLDKGVIRSYEGSNHIPLYSWNYGDYGVNDGNTYPNWMDFCIVQTESNYNTALVNNPTPIQPETPSAKYVW